MKHPGHIFKNYFPHAERLEIPRRTLLLREGEISNTIFFLEDGIARLWFNQEGKDITFQFFFKNSSVSSIESLYENKPSLFNLETITPCSVKKITKAQFLDKMDTSPTFERSIHQIISKRLFHYQKLFLSRIKDSPQKRYEELLQKEPELLLNIPHHYIASYLGITSVSFSRIRNRKLI